MVLKEECASVGPPEPRATQNNPITPIRAAQSGIEQSSKSTVDSFYTAEEYPSRISPETSGSIRRTRSAARNSSLLASESSRDIGTSSPASSTPLRSRADVNVKTNVTPHLDHVLSFHQKVSPSVLSPDTFTSLAIESDTPGSHDSAYSYFGNWRFYSPGRRITGGGRISPHASDDASTDDSDSSEGGHQVLLLPQPYFAPPTARSVPFVSAGHATPRIEPGAARLCAIPCKRSKSLSALPSTAFSSRRERPKSLPMNDSKRDHSRAFGISSSREAMLFARQHDYNREADTTSSTLDAYEIVANLDKSARNGRRAVLTPRLLSKPIQRLQKSVKKLLA